MAINQNAQQDKLGRKLDKNMFKKDKIKPLSESTWSELTQRGASLAEQMEWLKIKNREKEKQLNLNQD